MAEKKLRPISIIAWGPVQSLANGYFIRVYSLLEILVRSLNKPILLIEYNKDERNTFYTMQKCHLRSVRKINVRGNEKQGKIIIVKYLRLMIYQIVNILLLHRFFRKSKAVMLCSELFFISAIFLKLLGRDTVIIVDPQMLLSEREYRRGRKIQYASFILIEKVLFRLSNFVIAISEQMKSQLIEKMGVPPKRVIVIPHLLPSELRNNIHCKKSKAESSVIRLMFIGSLYAHHNLDAVQYLIKILPVLNKYCNKRVVLIIVGPLSNSVRDRIKELARLVKADNFVEILGYVRDLDETVCSKADVLVAPMFTMSGVSTKMLYYLKFSNKVIVASKEALEGLEQLANRHGKVVVARDPRDFVRRLLAVLRQWC